MEQKDVGIILNGNNIKLNRFYFKQMCKLIGLQVIYRAPMQNKVWDGYGELDGSFQPPEIVGCIFDEHPTEKTLKKLGWAVELDETSSLIHVPYDLHDVQVGALFIIPSGIDNSKGRVFKVIGIHNIAVYPASIVCELGPVYQNAFDRGTMQHVDNDMNQLLESTTDNNGSDFRYLREDK